MSTLERRSRVSKRSRLIRQTTLLPGILLDTPALRHLLGGADPARSQLLEMVHRSLYPVPRRKILSFRKQSEPEG